MYPDDEQKTPYGVVEIKKPKEDIKTAPLDVINELDAWKLKHLTHLYSMSDLIEDVRGQKEPLTRVTFNFLYDHDKSEDDYTNGYIREMAIMKHVYMNKRLEPEDEWYVLQDERVVTFTQHMEGRTATPYLSKMTEKQAKGFAELFGGEAMRRLPND